MVGDLLRAERAVGPVPRGQMVDRAEVVVDDEVGRGRRGEDAGALALLDERTEAFVVAPALGAHQFVLLGAQMVHRAEEDRGVVEVLDRRHDHVRGGAPQPLLHGLVGVREGVQALLLDAQHPRVHLVQEVVLGAEVVVERPLGDAGRLHDLLHRGAVVAPLREEPGGGGEQPLRDGRAVTVRRPGHCAATCLPRSAPAVSIRRCFGNAVPDGGSSHSPSWASRAGSPPAADICRRPVSPCSGRRVHRGRSRHPDGG